MALEFIDPQELARSENYFLKCKIYVQNITYEDEQSKGVTGLMTEEMVFLEPKEGTQRDLFFNAWMPDYEQDPVTKKIEPGHVELVCKAGNPIFGYFKCSFHRKDERFSKSPYLFVMSKGAEEDLKNMHGREIEVEIMGQDKEELGDFQKDFDLSVKKKITSKLEDFGG